MPDICGTIINMEVNSICFEFVTSLRLSGHLYMLMCTEGTLAPWKWGRGGVCPDQRRGPDGGGVGAGSAARSLRRGFWGQSSEGEVAGRGCALCSPLFSGCWGLELLSLRWSGNVPSVLPEHCDTYLESSGG